MRKNNERFSSQKHSAVAAAVLALTALPGLCSVDEPDPTAFGGNAYHDGGWISYGTDINKENVYLQFDSAADYVYSPRYAAPIRKIVMETRCSSSSAPNRFLTVMPYVQGAETPSLVATNAVFEGKDKLVVSSFDFSASVGVDAFRLGMTGGTGNWGVTRLAVIYGAKTDDEDALLREFAQQLPVPENLTLTHLASDALTVSASPVESAVSYCFELTKLTGCPRTELREDFVAAPNLSSGWTFGETNNVKVSSYSGDSSSYVDKDISEDRTALKIERKNEKDPVRLEIWSPEAPAGETFRECSFWSKCSGAGSDKIGVYGRVGESEDWSLLAEHVVTTTKDRQTIPLTADRDVRRIKFVFSANGDDCKSCALDSLCVAYGGNETRELVSAETNTTPEATWQNLESGRYGYRVKALGATEGDEPFKDSVWSEEQAVDLAWADVRLSPPEDLTFAVTGDKLNLSWTPVAMADHYEVKVALVDDPENPVATLAVKSASASVQITELGEYVVTVTAVSPGGVSKETSRLENCTVALGKVTELAVKATAADTIAATWKEVPLAESYQAKLFKVTGTAGTEISDYSKLPEGVWPDGWEHDADWLPDNLTTSGPKFTYDGEEVITKFQPVGITRVTFVVKSSSTSENKLDTQHLQVEAYSEKDGKWCVRADVDVDSTSQKTEELTFEIAEDIRRLRFTALTRNRNYQPAIQLGKVTVSYGEYVRTEVASVGTKEGAATYRGLDRTAKYVVVVTPQPSEGGELETSSEVVDLANEYFRPTGPVSLRSCHWLYQEDFASLSNVTKEADLAKVPLANWQFFNGSGEAERIFYTSGTNSTKGGVYCYSDAERSTDSFMIGTVASSTIGSSLGIAFVNDTDAEAVVANLTFRPVQRNVKAKPTTYVLEYLVTDGPWSIGTESDAWQTLAIPETAPKTTDNPKATNGVGPEGVTVSLADGGSPLKLRAGQVIVFRWRHEKMSSGPMMGIDDVRVEFRSTSGFALVIR